MRNSRAQRLEFALAYIPLKTMIVPFNPAARRRSPAATILSTIILVFANLATEVAAERLFFARSESAYLYAAGFGIAFIGISSAVSAADRIIIIRAPSCLASGPAASIIYYAAVRVKFRVQRRTWRACRL